MELSQEQKEEIIRHSANVKAENDRFLGERVSAMKSLGDLGSVALAIIRAR